MATLTFDTYEFIQTLKAAGLDEEQAKALSGELRKMQLNHVATKDDLRNLEVSLLRQFGELEGRFQKNLDDTRATLTRWFAATVIGQAGLVAAMLVLAG